MVPALPAGSAPPSSAPWNHRCCGRGEQQGEQVASCGSIEGSLLLRELRGLSLSPGMPQSASELMGGSRTSTETEHPKPVSI